MPVGIYGAVAEEMARRFGGRVVSETQTFNWVAGAQLLAAHDAERVGLLLVNIGTEDAMLWIDPQVSVTRGIVLAANGGLLSMSVDIDLVLPSLQWWAVGSGALAKIVSVIYIRRDTSVPKEA